MKRKRLTLIFYIVFLNIVLISLMFFGNNSSSKELIEKSSERNFKKNTFAVMLEGNNGYVASETNVWPVGMMINKDLTNCIDKNNNKVDINLLYEDGSIIVESNKKVFCYLYFDKIELLVDYILVNKPNGFNSSIEGGMYRFQGPQTDSEGNTIDNYVCFGTSDKDECVNDITNHMYRVIGVTEDKRMKVIKVSNVGATSWQTGCDSNFCMSNISWASSVPKSLINGSSFLNKENYLPIGWVDLIADTSWKYGSISNVNNNASAVYNAENSWTSTVNAKIGLMYISDYYYAYQTGGLNCSTSGSYSTCAKAWIHMSNNDPGYTSSHYDWTMVRGDTASNGGTQAHIVWALGHLSPMNIGRPFYMRPVFYLKSDTKYVSGTGTITDPFITKLAE